MKFSIVIPAYNSEKYIQDCFDSILEQSYPAYEIIVIDDGSSDNTAKIVQNYAKNNKQIKYFYSNHFGVAKARNLGISKVKGDYFVFVDSDDSITSELLSMLKETIEKDNWPDLVKYQLQTIEKETKEYKNPIFSNERGEKAFSKLLVSPMFVTPVTYAYKMDYWRENQFTYERCAYEDFGLTPFVVIKAKTISSIDYVGYNYFIRENSIMTTVTEEKLKSKNEDAFYHFDRLLTLINDEKKIEEKSKEIFRSYITNAIIDRCIEQNKKTWKSYYKELKSRNLSQYLLRDNLKRKIKYLFFKYLPHFYIQIFVR